MDQNRQKKHPPYLHIPGGVAQSLAAFAKTPVLTAGESCEVALHIDLADNAVYQEENARWELPQGEYRLYIGKNSRDTVTAAALTLAETVTVRQCHTCCKTPHARPNWRAACCSRCASIWRRRRHSDAPAPRARGWNFSLWPASRALSTMRRATNEPARSFRAGRRLLK